jgi:MoaA/NifB/PqqE/SkfB family radical SAM enzyme
MIAFEDIRDVHLEISTLCNAACPLCPRNFHGYPYNDGYPELNFTLENAKHIFTTAFIKQLKNITINGNYGDIVMNPEGADIVEYFRSHSDILTIEVQTNGSARNAEFWQRLAKAKTKVVFALDGLEDLHHLHRQNTVWSTVIKNAKIFISAGGTAIWKFIKFDHNEHQIESCKKLSTDLGFARFEVVMHGRDTGPVYNKNGEHTHTLGKYQGNTDFKELLFRKKNDLILLEDLEKKPIKDKVTCQAYLRKSIYIAANGDVSPCCWTGFYPKTYGRGEYHQPVNQQLAAIFSKNNALEYNLPQCIAWFTSIQQSWKQKSYESGRLVICDDVCGSHLNT